jgi:hypothetical protein
MCGGSENGSTRSWNPGRASIVKSRRSPKLRMIGFSLGSRGKGGVEAPGLRFWSVFWIADGKVTRRQVFLDREEALEAAGLSE